jgi:hypothetical protein
MPAPFLRALYVECDWAETGQYTDQFNLAKFSWLGLSEDLRIAYASVPAVIY